MSENATALPFECNRCGLPVTTDSLHMTEEDCIEDFKLAIMSLFRWSEKRRYGRLHKQLERMVKK